MVPKFILKQPKKAMSTFRQGFTLVEILVVVGILGLLSIAIGASYVNSLRTGRDSRRKADMETLRQAVELYKSDNPSVGYPNGTGSTQTALMTILTSPVPYINSPNFPKDPETAKNYYYERLTASTYNLCAVLEVNPSPDATCQAKSCGASGCNYLATQP